MPKFIFNQLMDLIECFPQAHDLTSVILLYLRGAYLPRVDNLTLRRIAFLFIYSQLDLFLLSLSY